MTKRLSITSRLVNKDYKSEAELSKKKILYNKKNGENFKMKSKGDGEYRI